MNLVVMWIVENYFISLWWIRIDLMCVLRSKMTGFSVIIEINWVFVSGHRNRHDVRVGIEIDLISVMGSK